MEQLGHYQILEKLGQGSMGVVYKALHLPLNRLVALKMMSTKSVEPELKARFYREAQTAARLQHPNIVTVYEFGEEGDRMFIAMELVEGKSLKELIRENPPLDYKLEIILQICRGLAHAHQNEVIHRDVKPSNIYIDTHTSVKILDFGIALLASSELTQTGKRVGTPEYASPEVITGEKADNRSDIFSCGITFYEFLTQIKPFHDASVTAVLFNILNKAVTPLVELVPDCPPQLSKIIYKALEKNPNKRHQRLEEMIEELEEVQSHFVWKRAERIKELRELSQSRQQLIEDCNDLEQALIQDRHQERLHERSERLRRLGNITDRSVSLPEIEQEIQSAREVSNLLDDFVKQELPWLAERIRTNIADLELCLSEDQAEKAELLLKKLERGLTSDRFLSPWRQRVADSKRRLEEAARSQELAQLFSRAQQNYDAGGLPECLACLQQLFLKEPEHLPGRELERLVSEEMERRREKEARRERIAFLMTAAERDFQGARFTDCIKACDEILMIQPNHEKARFLQESARRQLQEAELERVRRGESERLLETAKHYFAQKDFANSILAIEKVLQFDPQNEEAQSVKMLILQEIHREEEIRTFLESARKALSGRLYAEAKDFCRRALELDPANDEGLRLKDEIELAIDRNRKEEEKRQNIARLYEEASRLFQSGALRESRSLLQEIRRLEPRHQPALQLGEEIERQLSSIRSLEKLQRKVDKLLSESEQARWKGKIDKALRLCHKALEMDPENATAQDLLRNLQELRDLSAWEPGTSSPSKHASRPATRLDQVLDEFYNSARTKLKRGDNKGAKEDISKILDLKPDHTAALTLRQLLDQPAWQPAANATGPAVRLLAARMWDTFTTYLSLLRPAHLVAILGLAALLLTLAVWQFRGEKPQPKVNKPPAATPGKIQSESKAEKLRPLLDELSGHMADRTYQDTQQLPTLIQKIQLIQVLDPSNSTAVQALEEITNYHQQSAERFVQNQAWNRALRIYELLTTIFPQRADYPRRIEEIRRLRIQQAQAEKEMQNEQLRMQNLNKARTRVGAFIKSGAYFPPPDSENAWDAILALEALAPDSEEISEYRRQLKELGMKEAERALGREPGKAREIYRKLIMYYPTDSSEFESPIARIDRLEQEQLQKQALASLRQQLGGAYRRGDFNRVIELSQPILKSSSLTAAEQFYLGWSYMKTGQNQLAREYLTQSLRSEPNNSMASFHLGEIYYQMQDRDRAHEHFNKALEGELSAGDKQHAASIVEKIDLTRAGQKGFAAKHKHGFLVLSRGCEGIVSFGGQVFRYRNPQHNFTLPLSGIRKFEINKDEIKVSTRSKDEYSFQMQGTETVSVIQKVLSTLYGLTGQATPNGYIFDLR